MHSSTEWLCNAYVYHGDGGDSSRTNSYCQLTKYQTSYLAGDKKKYSQTHSMSLRITSHSMYSHMITNPRPASIENNVNELHSVSLHALSQITYYHWLLLVHCLTLIDECHKRRQFSYYRHSFTRLPWNLAIHGDRPTLLVRWCLALSVQWTMVRLSECLAGAKLSELVALCILNWPTTVAQSKITNYLLACCNTVTDWVGSNAFCDMT